VEGNRIPKSVLYMNLGTTRLRGRPRNRWQDEVREDGRIVKRLLRNQLVISVITELILSLNSFGVVFDIIMVMSSANSIGLANLFMLKERSFIYIINSKGPNIEPCGTQCFTCTQLEDSLLGLLLFTDNL